jgi:multidrug efflux system outer membrane protein
MAATLVAALLALSGCAAIPADHDVLPQQDLARVQLAGDIKLAREGWPAAQWWTQYRDPQLDKLMQQALAGGPTLAVAASRIGAARAALAFDRADAGVRVDLTADASRQRYSSNGLLSAPIGGSYYNEQTVQLQASYEFDWWGKHRSAIAAALGEVNASRADYAMAEQTLAAEVAASYFALQTGWARVANLRHMANTLQALVDDKAKRVAHGLAPIDQQLSAAAQLSYLEQTVAQLQSRIKREREALRALVGADGTALAGLTPAPLKQVGFGLPSSLGINLLARRPDLQAARWRVQASLSRVEMSQAAFYPTVDLTGAFGLDALKLGDLLKSGSRTLFVGPALSLPLFDSHRLDARLGAARSERNELIADYNQTVFAVVRDVAQAGVDLQGVQQQMTHQAATLAATEALRHSAEAKFKQGLAANSDVLLYDSAVLLQVDAGLQLQGAQLNAEVALVHALGGGYYSNRDSDSNQSDDNASVSNTL